MYLAQFRAENFRLFDTVELQPHPRLSFITGANAAGKTSLLESVYCLARGKSFRSGTPAELAGTAKAEWAVAGDFETDGLRSGFKLCWTRAGSRLTTAAGEDLALATAVRLHPAQLVEPALHRLVQDGPAYRRAYLDWGVFHVEQGFLECWRRFQRSLRQRNEALRTGRPDAEVRVWHPDLAMAAETLQAHRSQHMADLEPHLQRYTQELLGEVDWAWQLRQGWDASTPYRDILQAQLARDRRMATTAEGPHRADLVLQADGRRARQRISRGQEKLLLCALVLAQADLIGQRSGQWPLLLVDDFSAELAPEFQRRLMAALLAYRGQCFVTAFDLPVLPAGADFFLFHVEHRQVLKC